MNGELTYCEGGEEITIDLFAEDYGHERGREIVAALHGSGMSRSNPVLFCMATGRAQAVYLREVRGRMYASHFDGSACSGHSPSPMSDEHKRQVEYVVRAADAAGFSVATEVSLGTGVRPDVVVRGECAVGVEVQRSALSKHAAVTRTARAIEAGLATSTWISDRDYPNDMPRWFREVPSVGMNRLPWDVLPPGRAVTAQGLREVHEVRCAWPEIQKCPVTKGRPCGRWHVAHRPWTGMTLDDVAEMAPQRGIVPISWFGQYVLLVSPRSRALFEGITGRSPDWRPAVRPPANRQRRRIECVKPPEAVEQVSCCGERHPAVAGSPLKPRCMLCPNSPTYWRRES